ncbi:MAG: hypothetical protein R3E66_22105 [bacterium]
MFLFSFVFGWERSRAGYAGWALVQAIDDASFATAGRTRPWIGVDWGRVRQVYLAHSVRIIEPSPTTAFLPIQFKRGIAHTTDELAQLGFNRQQHLSPTFPEAWS